MGYRGTMPDNTMRTVHFYAYGGPEQLVVEQVPRPEPQVGEVLVHAAGVNPIDWKIRVFPLAAAAQAQALSETGHGRGRIILHIAGERETDDECLYRQGN